MNDSHVLRVPQPSRCSGPSVIRVLTGLFALLFALSSAAANEGRFIAGAFDPPRQAPAFALPGSDGNELRLENYRGRVVILGFGFTSCPDVCPTTLTVLAQARRNLGARAKETQVVYITVDPQTDTADRMGKYLATFDASFVGGTGTEEQLAAVRREYGILASKKMYGSDYTYAHSSYTYLIDRSGRIRALMPYGHTAQDYVHDIGVLLKE